MVFYSKNPIIIPVLLLFIISTTGWYNPLSSVWINFFGFSITLLIALSILINYELKIEEDKITYTIYLYHLKIYQKRVTPEQIKQLRLKRLGWTSKGAIIQVHQGMNLRVINFMPHDFDDELTKFANRHSIAIWRNKDYELVKRFE